MSGGFLTSAALIGIATGLLTAAWGHIKTLLLRIWSVVFVNSRATGTMATAVKSYAWANYRRSPFGERRYCAERAWVRPLKRIQQVGYEMLGLDPILFWNGWRPLLMSAGKGNGPNNEAPDSSEVKMTFIRGTFNCDKLMEAALERYNEFFISIGNTQNEHKRFRIRRMVGMGGRRRRNEDTDGKLVSKSGGEQATLSVDTGEYRFLQWKRAQLGPEITEGHKALDSLALTSEVLEAVDELKHWLKSAKWYQDRQIPWTRGWLLYGPPGTGKSRFIRSVAEDCDLPIYIFDLSSMSNDEFLRYWDEMRGDVPCIAAFEDLDAVFRGRDNVSGEQGGGLTFDCFLNAISGIEGAEGVLKIMTTNHVEHLDPALGVPQKGNQGSMSTRPGRVDRAIEMPQLDEAGRQKIAARILADCPELIDALVENGTGDTGAQFTDRCIRVALEDFWRKKEGQPCRDFKLTDSGRRMASANDDGDDEKLPYSPQLAAQTVTYGGQSR